MFTGGFDSAPYEVIGIARDHKVRSVGEAPRPYLHLPAGPSLAVGLVVRTTMPSETALPMLRQAVLSLDPNVVFTEDTSATHVAETTVTPTRLAAVMVGTFGALAMVLASEGLYGVVAYSVGRRTREIGVRMSLGATRADVLRLIFFQGGRLTLAGVALGTDVSAGVGRLLESLLYGVSSFDPAAYGAAATLLLAVTFAANLVPAVAAARTDPQCALRVE